MTVKEAKYFMISDEIDWQSGDNHLIGYEDNLFHYKLEQQGFTTALNGNHLPSNIVVNNMVQYLKTQKKPDVLGDAYHYNPQQTLIEATEIMNHNLQLVRESIFEEVRLQHFPHLPSRRKCIWVIPKERECLKYWMGKLKSPKAKIYELNLTGKIHRSPTRTLELISYPPALLRRSAYRYWLGTLGTETPQDEVIFTGLLDVVKVIDAVSAQ